jgi:hypothetical protein
MEAKVPSSISQLDEFNWLVLSSQHCFVRYSSSVPLHAYFRSQTEAWVCEWE